MVKIEINDALYRKAERVAKELGFPKTEEFVTEAIERRLLRLRQKEFIERTDFIKRLAKYRELDVKKLLRGYE